jgi:hypothetical protein
LAYNGARTVVKKGNEWPSSKALTLRQKAQNQVSTFYKPIKQCALHCQNTTL